ncbi:MAG TPA: tetratricopeptide repeat protein [Candidatus Polarisedimenticolaceae bacterium]|nr:tetratricopeptide repeat protein [Candidatus Polarisedimenticolaceae bacterium]
MRSSSRSDRCAVGVDPSDPALPVVGHGSLAGVRKSRRAPWRAVVLIAVQLLIVVHAVHFLVAKRTLSPIEPSESMYTLELGYLNCGFLFFALSLLATLAFGRFFCGWACHIVAVQDLCGWLMKRLGIRPRPFRSRLLAWAPLVVALYMFVWPTFKRLLFTDRPFPGLSNHLVTSGFWDTFPGPLFAGLTFLTCGFAAVYFLGAKGFCTYGCPYGALFAATDRFSPTRILVTDACRQCGHCTATCTSNVRVHEEVKLYGMVVDPGCMKCMDCISVCPTQALHLGFGKPAVLKGVPPVPPAGRYNLGWLEEVGLATVSVGAALAFRGLYDGPPLLMAVGLGGISGFLALKLWQLWRQPTVRLQNLNLKLGGRLGASGKAFAAVAGIWLLFAAHSGFVQWHRAWGGFWLQRTEATRADVLSGAFRQRAYSPRHAAAAQRTLHHFALAERFGLVDVLEVKLGLAWAHLLRGEDDPAIALVRQAIALAPASAEPQRNLIELLVARGRLDEAAEALERKLAATGPSAEDEFALGGLLVELGRPEPAIEHFRKSLALVPGSAPAHYNLGGLLRRLGRNREAVVELLRATELAPTDADAQIELGLALAADGDAPQAIAALRRAIALAPDSPESRQHLPGLIERLEQGRGLGD